MGAEGLAHDALDAIATHRAPVDLARYRQSQARTVVRSLKPVAGVGSRLGECLVGTRTAGYRLLRGLPMQGKHRQRYAPAVLEYAVEVGTCAYPRGAREAVRWHRGGNGGRWRPLRHQLRLGAETLAALGAATRQDLAAIGGRHAGTKTVVALALEVAGLKSALWHGSAAVYSGIDRQRYRRCLTRVKYREPLRDHCHRQEGSLRLRPYRLMTIVPQPRVLVSSAPILLHVAPSDGRRGR